MLTTLRANEPYFINLTADLSPELCLCSGLKILRSDWQIGITLDPTKGVHVTRGPRAVHVFAVLGEADLSHVEA